MKGKTLLSLAIVLSMILAALPLVAVKASPTTVEVVFDNGLNSITKAVGTEFVVSIKIFDTPAISQYIVELSWDPAVLELKTGAEADVHKGTFLGGDVFLVTIGLPGHIDEVTEAKLSGTQAGTGLLFTVDFRAKAAGDSAITLVRHVLLNGLVVVDNTAVDGLVHVPAPPATAPNAEFTPLDGASVLVGSTVNLVSTSTPGFDTLPPPGETAPITDWKWTIDFHNGTIVVLSGESNSFVCDSSGLVTITLTVNATDPTPPGSGIYADGWETNSEVHTIMQAMPYFGPVIDVYTDKGGNLINSTTPLDQRPYKIGWSDAYGPQELVTVYAKVTYNFEPVEYKPVGFEMIDPHNVTRDYRVAFTDPNGIANTTFRIPWEGSNAELLFGNWSIFGSVDIAGQIKTDVVKFQFGYILSIRGITVTGSPLKKGQTLTIDVDIQSISMLSQDAFVTIVTVDEPGVPIGLFTTWFSVDPEDGNLQTGGITPTILIPQWAFVGNGKIYVNLFTYPPSLGGVPYCPEGNAAFVINKT